MIPLFHLLLAVVTICSASSKYTIDWNLCRNEVSCFMLDQCLDVNNLTVQNALATYEDIPEPARLANQKCPLGVQIRSFSKDKALYFIQVNQAMQSKNISIYHDDTLILSCLEESGKIAISIENPLYSKLIPKPYEDLSYFDSEQNLCAFTLEGMNSLEQLLNSHRKSSIKFDTNTYAAKKKGLEMLKTDKILCDLDLIGDVKEKHNFHVLPVKDRARMSLDCSHYKSDLGLTYDYNLYVGQEEADPVKVTSLDCADNGKGYEYKIKNGTTDVVLTDPFYAYCAVTKNKTCTNPLNCTGSLCPQLSPGSNTVDATLNCNGGKWLIDGTYYEEIQPVCHPNYANEPLFFITLPPGVAEEELKSGKCYTEYDCKIKSNLADDDTMEMGAELYCRNETDILLIENQGTKINGMKKFTCDAQTGEYKSTSAEGAVVKVPFQARISCKKKEQKQKEDLTAAATVGYPAGAAVASTVAVIVLTTLIFFLCFRQKRSQAKFVLMNKREVWKRMAASSKVFEARLVFGKAGHSDSEFTLLDALKLLDTILECETEEHEVWEAVDTFIRRLQTAAFYKDFPLERTLNRYFYLHARKIIDKHGWISQTPITKSKPNGFIRACAIRLLALARRDDIDAQSMVLEGFKKLRYNGVDQYPHCGLLWAVVAQQRAGNMALHYKSLRNLVQLFDQLFKSSEATEQEKKSHIEDIAEANRFPQFGSVKHQIAFALGAADLHGQDAIPQIPSEETLNRRILEGILYSTSGNTCGKINNLLIKKEQDKARKDGTKEVEVRTKRFYDLLDEIRSLMEPVFTMMIFQQRLREAKYIKKDLEFRDKNRKQCVENMLKAEERQEAEGIVVQHAKESWEEKLKEKVKRNEKMKPEDAFIQAKATYEDFITALEHEKKSILEWLIDKIKKEEAMKLGRNKSKTDPDKSKSNSSQSNPIQVKEGPTGQTKSFPEEYEESFHKITTPPPRITTCTLNEADQSKLRALLQMMLDKKTTDGRRATIPVQDAIFILDNAASIFESEPLFIEDVPAGISVVGDSHGQIYDVARVFDANAKDGKPGYETAKYLFLGDYVDRGSHILETALTLFILKILYPDRFWLLRGNHEFIDQNCKYLTVNEIEERYNVPAAEFIYYKMNETFCFMPICAVIGGQIFCAHGGISATSMTRQELRQLRKPFADTHPDSLLGDVLWSDPHKGLDGFMMNSNRGSGIYYGENFLQSTLERMDCTALIRAHQMMQDGYEIPFPNCLSIFTATSVDNKNNDGAFVRIAEDLKYEIVRYKFDPIREGVFHDAYGAKEADDISQRQDIGGCLLFGNGSVAEFGEDDE